MKKKAITTKQPEPRKRRTNLELAGFGRKHLQTIRQISDQSRVPIEQVLADVIENGLISVMPMYETMIEFRKTRETKLKDLFNRNEPISSEPVRQGISEEQNELAPIEHQPAPESSGFTNGDTLTVGVNGDERPGDVVVGLGREPEAEEDFGINSTDYYPGS